MINEKLETENYIQPMNNSLSKFFSNAFKVFIKSPRLAFLIYSIIRKQRKASRLRLYWEGQGVHVPPYMIASITNVCNLKCKGCYAKAHNRVSGLELTCEHWIKIFGEARELGISVIFLAGGEPFSRNDILDITAKFQDIVFPVFTNGILIDDSIIVKLKEQKNIIPIISMEGYEEETDNRRGKGVYEKTCCVMEKINRQGIIFGVSITVTSHNYDIVTGEKFIRKLTDTGCRLFFYVEYVAVEEDTQDLVLTNIQRQRLGVLMNELHSEYNGLFIAFPGDEEKFGGCLAAGRGFVHVSPEGNLEPCPFSPYSDACLKNSTLKEALKSEFLKKIRQAHDSLTETEGGCALWNNRDWVKSLLQKTDSE